MLTNNIASLVLLNVGYAAHNADWNYQRVRSPFARIYYVTKGAASVKLDSGTYWLRPDHLYLLPPFTSHSDKCVGIFELYYIHVYSDTAYNNNVFSLYDFPFESLASNLDLLLIERLMAITPNRELPQYDPKLYDDTPTLINSLAISAQTPFDETMETQGIILQLLSRFLKNATSKYASSDSRVVKAIEYINTHIERNISIDELAETCCLSPDHFIRLFKKATRQTPLNYINERKIQRAQTLLVFTNKQVKDISYQLSFDNVSYFNRLFKKYTGKTPMKYRAIR
jgi:AraC-like DNA-binding protein